MAHQYAFALLVATFTSLVVAALAWQRRSSEGARGLLLIMLSAAIWTLTYAFRWLSSDPASQSFWLDMTYLGVVVAPVAFLIMALEFTRRENLLTRRNLALISIIPFLTLIILATDQWHGLFYAGKRASGSILDGGLWFWINAVYLYLNLFLAAILVLKTYLNSTHIYRQQAAIILAGMFLPWIGNIISLAGFSPFPGLDTTPFLFIGSGIIFMFGLSQYRLLDIVPIARTSIVELMEDGIVVIDKEKRIVDINPAAQKIFKTTDGVIGSEVSTIFTGWERLLPVQLSLTPYTMDLRRNGNEIHEFEVNVTPLFNKKKVMSGQVYFFHDITERKLAEEKIRQSEEQYRQLFENAIESIAVVQNGNIVFCNPITRELTGYTQEELSHQPFQAYIHPDDLPLVQTNHARRLNGEPVDSKYQFRLIRKDNEVRWVEISGIKIDWEGKPSTLNFINDITERKLAEMALEHRSNHDILTGLYNRQYYEEEILRIQHHAKYPVTVIVIDMNGLKKINDSKGHGVGDECLRRVASVLQKAFRQDDVIARIGGDEFAILLPHTDEADADNMLERVKKHLQEHNTAYPTEEQISLAIGSATGDQQVSIHEVFRMADARMYRNKAER